MTLLGSTRHRILNAFVLFLCLTAQVANPIQAALVVPGTGLFKDLVDGFDRFLGGHLVIIT